MVAVDGSAAMVEKAREVLGDRGRRYLVADLAELELAEPVDARLLDRRLPLDPRPRALFRRLRAALRPGGRLVAQCGGEGNIDRASRRRSPAVAAASPSTPRTWPGDRAVELRRRRGDRARACARPASRRSAAGCSPEAGAAASPLEFISHASPSARYLDQLPEELREPFVERRPGRSRGEPLIARLRPPQHRGRRRLTCSVPATQGARARRVECRRR